MFLPTSYEELRDMEDEHYAVPPSEEEVNAERFAGEADDPYWDR